MLLLQLQTGSILVPDFVTAVVNLMTAFGLLAVCSLVSPHLHPHSLHRLIAGSDDFDTCGNSFTRHSTSLAATAVSRVARTLLFCLTLARSRTALDYFFHTSLNVLDNFFHTLRLFVTLRLIFRLAGGDVVVDYVSCRFQLASPTSIHARTPQFPHENHVTPCFRQK